MGQTLSHGVYLPAEGERNCYSGLASNWNLLDTAIGDTAGKASATHTHGNISNDGKVGTTANLPLITGTGGAIQAGSFGNAANTFCEGNDSRLSDARTPVAHTHLTADVTDLLNGNHTWTGDNTYTTPVNYKSTHTLGNLPVSVDAQQAFRILDSAGTDFLCDTASFQNTTASGLRFTIRDKFDSNGFSPSGTNRSSYLHFLQNANRQSYLQWDGYTKNNVIPLTTNTYDLGSSSYQWNNLYAKNYYYNGVAWGLDKNNRWLTTNLFYGSLPIFLRGSDNDIYNVSPQSLVQSLISFVDKNNTTMSNISFQHRPEATETHRLCLRQQKVTSNGYYGVNLNNLGDFYPDPINTINLGTSTNKWKTLNGINPGALSLPNLSINTATGNNPPNGYVDIDTTNWDLTGSNPISYTPPVDGWISIRGKDEVGNFIFATQICIRQSVLATGASSALASGLSLVMPVNKNVAVTIYCKVPQTSLIAYFTPCQGNV